MSVIKQNDSDVTNGALQIRSGKLSSLRLRQYIRGLSHLAGGSVETRGLLGFQISRVVVPSGVTRG